MPMGGNKKIAVIGVGSLMLWLVFFFAFTTVTQPTGINVGGEITVTELEDMMDEVDTYIRLRYGDRLFNENTGTYEQGYEHYLNLAQHYGILPSTSINYTDLNKHLVPYVGADYDLNLGIYGLKAFGDSNFARVGVPGNSYFDGNIYAGSEIISSTASQIYRAGVGTGNAGHYFLPNQEGENTVYIQALQNPSGANWGGWQVIFSDTLNSDEMYIDMGYGDIHIQPYRQSPSIDGNIFLWGNTAPGRISGVVSKLGTQLRPWPEIWGTDINATEVSASYFFGDGSGLTNLTATTDVNDDDISPANVFIDNNLIVGGDTNVDTIGITNSFGGTYYGTWTEGSVLFTGVDGNIYQNNSNLFWSDSNNRLGIGQNLGFDTNSTGLSVTGDIDLTHTAVASDDHALDIDADAAGFGDVKAIDIGYTTGAISTGKNEAIILIDIDESAATGGDVVGVEILATEGAASIYGLEAGVLVSPIVQLSGVFGNMDSATVSGVDRLTEFTSTASDITMFVGDDDNITIGNAAKFEEIEFLLDTVANPGIAPTFEFSTGVGTWTAFSPTDGTNELKHNGVIAWKDEDIPTWATGFGSEYIIRITRTKNNLASTPKEDKIQIASATKYEWDKYGDVHVRDVNVERDLNVAGSDSNIFVLGVHQIFGDGSGLTGVTATTDWADINLHVYGIVDINAEFVPYIGADTDLNLGTKTIKARGDANFVNIGFSTYIYGDASKMTGVTASSGWPADTTLDTNGDAQVWFGTEIAALFPLEDTNIQSYIPSEADIDANAQAIDTNYMTDITDFNAQYCPYIGADYDLNLGAYGLKAFGDTNFNDVGISGNLYNDGNTTTDGLLLYEPIHSKTTNIVARPNAVGGGTLTIDLWGNTNKTLYISNWAGHDLIGLDQDLRHDAAGGVTFTGLTISGGVSFGELILTGLSTDGTPVFDVTGKDGADGFGSPAKQGQGVTHTTGDGGTGYGAVGGAGGDHIVVLGSGGSGTSSGRDGQFTITNLPTDDPGILNALWIDWNNSIKISTG